MCEATKDSRGAGWYCCRCNTFNMGKLASLCWVCDKKRHEERPVPRKPDGEPEGASRVGGTHARRRRNPQTRKATGNNNPKEESNGR